jgi:type IV pilus assembly protein PilB
VLAKDDYILELLIREGRVTSEDVATAQQAATENGQGSVQELIRQEKVTQLEVLKILADEAGLGFQEEVGFVPERVVERVPRSIAVRYQVMPLSYEDNLLRLAISDPFDFETIDIIQKLLNAHQPYDTEFVVVPQARIEESLANSYAAPDEMSQRQSGGANDTTTIGDGDGPIIAYVNQTISEAYKLKASDIHLEPLEKRFRLRYRIDGVLQEMKDLPKKLQPVIISRLKIMSRMSIAEKRMPQDGRIQMATGDGKQLDLRVSSVPTVHGEAIVMRILDKSSLTLGLPELGFLSDDQAVMEKILGLPDGIFLVTGPTGSGKSTTLYACLHYLNKPDRKIITVEDPIEYQLSGVNQVPVNHDVGMTFAAALRSMLRQAPNIIMVGEIRDAETAMISINASLTGHLVFSTLHTNDAPSAVTRLIDIGIKPFLVASSVRAILAQRLIRKVCPKCAESYLPSETELRTLNISSTQLDNANFRKGRGCDHCRGTGYKGRAGIFEIFIIDDEIRNMINDKQSPSALRNRARALGMRTLREDGIRKVLAGMTTPDEVITTTMGDKN